MLYSNMDALGINKPGWRRCHKITLISAGIAWSDLHHYKMHILSFPDPTFDCLPAALSVSITQTRWSPVSQGLIWSCSWRGLVLNFRNTLLYLGAGPALAGISLPTSALHFQPFKEHGRDWWGKSFNPCSPPTLSTCHFSPSVRWLYDPSTSLFLTLALPFPMCLLATI